MKVKIPFKNIKANEVLNNVQSVRVRTTLPDANYLTDDFMKVLNFVSHKPKKKCTASSAIVLS